MKKTKNYLKIILFIIIPLVVGFTSSIITKNSMMIFNIIKKPPLSPPGILFPIVWSILYIMMGISSYLVIESESKLKIKWIIIYSIQLIFNFFWSIIFFKLKQYYFAFIWLLALWILVMILINYSKKINKLLSYFLIPYILWMTFAGYLNIGIALLN